MQVDQAKTYVTIIYSKKILTNLQEPHKFTFITMFHVFVKRRL